MGIVDSNSVESAAGDPVKPLEKAVRRIQMELPDFFDDELAAEVLSLEVGAIISSSNLMLKSMYEFDLDTEDGITRLLELLPIIDPDILKTVMQEIWPGYPVDSLNFDNSLAREEIGGYLLDFLEGHGTEEEDIDSTDEGQPDGGAETPEPSSGEETAAGGAGGGAETPEPATA